MEDESRAMVTNLLVGIRESSFSGNPSLLYPLPRGCRPESPPPTRFKGVVLQQNGKWGAQIYANHQRIWLGTFKSEWSAAVAYDRAATKLRSSDPNRNFPCLVAYEPEFQELYTTDAVLGMIRDGSYDSKLAEFLRTTGGTRSEEATAGPAGHQLADNGGVVLHELFQKELTPSDVGKLNRLVIPKKYAVKHFPHIPASERDRVGRGGYRDGQEGATEGIMLEFKDLHERSWEFRYCYWKSSQSFVFTKGWSKFVKTKDLRAKDTVSFYRCDDLLGMRRTFFLINVGRGGAGDVEADFFGCVRGSVHGDEERGMRLAGGVRGMFEIGSNSSSWGRTSGEAEEGEVVMESMAPAGLQDKRSIRLFGVQIGER